ncbi:Uncharacterised protein [Rodentibacter pneumotropicus]|uniref:Uncharacterized protein n=1 Tax=Rodentibacter pneumotropicus TaxID=758 RepID=A0A3S4U021_9PAST|nr:Uncharacterised protein [Rodentibacter pneumotropicus]
MFKKGLKIVLAVFVIISAYQLDLTHDYDGKISHIQQ